MSFRASTRALALNRIYLYTVDHLGQIFLEGTKIRNFTTNYKDPAFLDFLYTRIKVNDRVDEESRKLREKGYEFVSLCGQECNYLKPDDAVLVYQKLIDGNLSFAGTFHHPFNPKSLLVSPKNGYLYHPSPPKPSKRLVEKSIPSPYGEYSLLSSSIVLEKFSDSLQLEEDGTGTFEWEGIVHKIGMLSDGMVQRSKVSD